MIPGEIPNWVAAIPLVAMAIIDVLWGLDMVSAEVAREDASPRTVSTSGDAWLGVREVIKAVFLLGALAFVFLLNPNGMVPTWWGVAMFAAAIATVLALVFLSLTPVAKKESDDDA